MSQIWKHLYVFFVITKLINCKHKLSEGYIKYFHIFANKQKRADGSMYLIRYVIEFIEYGNTHTFMQLPYLVD